MCRAVVQDLLVLVDREHQLPSIEKDSSRSPGSAVAVGCRGPTTRCGGAIFVPFFSDECAYTPPGDQGNHQIGQRSSKRCSKIPRQSPETLRSWPLKAAGGAAEASAQSAVPLHSRRLEPSLTWSGLGTSGSRLSQRVARSRLRQPSRWVHRSVDALDRARSAGEFLSSTTLGAVLDAVDLFPQLGGYVVSVIVGDARARSRT
jgi:hypothetical protein